MSTKTGRTGSPAHKRHHRSQPNRSARARPAPASTIKPPPPGPRSKPRPGRARRRFDPSWGQVIVVGLVLVAGAMLYIGSRSSGGEVRSGQAPPFTLASTDGSNVSLSDFAGRDVLLYFNEGVGCDACFYQTVELEKRAADLDAAGITVLPVVMNPLDQVRSELVRFGITTPYLIDADGRVSRDYGVMGKGMHANLPGHGFVLIDGDGRVRWQKEYPSMYAPTSELLAAIDPYLS